MSNGHVCCILGVCCQPPGGGASREALAQELDAHVDTKDGTAVANWLFDNYDLVPKGLASAIITLYGPEFEKRYG